MAETASKSRSLLAPIISAIVLIALFVLIIAFRQQLADVITRSSTEGGSRLVAWVPDHLDETLAIVVGFFVAIGINWIAHVAGRLRAWLFVFVVEIGLWILFWNSLGIPSLRELVGLNPETLQLNGTEQAVSLIIILFLSGIVFWILEAREAWKQRRESMD
jgi:preprotein translocase subunit YajC